MAATETFDVNRATDVLNKAAEHKMYEAGPDGKAILPESDGDKIVEAEKLVAMAQQARSIAEQVGKDKVPSYDIVMEILFIADVTGGSSTNGQAAAEPEPSAEAVANQEDYEHDQRVEQERLGVNYAIGEEWTDANSTTWVIKGDVDKDGNIEASLVGSDEVTSVPVVSLQTRTKAAPEAEPAPPSIPQPPPPVPASEPDGGSDDPEIPIDGDEDDEEYSNLIEKSEATYTKTGLPLPLQPSNPPRMPDDLTTIGDEEQRTLHSQFNACAARAHFMLGIERQRKLDCKRVLNSVLKPAMRNAREKLGKDATVTELKSMAEEDPMVIKWMTRTERHGDREDAYRTLYEIYSENVSVLSRDWTMRSMDEAGS